MAKPEIDSNRFGPVLKVRSRWGASLEKLLVVKNIKQLDLDYSNGWRGSDLNFLATLPYLEGLYIRDLSGLDVSGVQFASKLKRLHVHIWKKPSEAVTFERLGDLESCEIDWNPALQSVLICAGLKRLAISDMKGVPCLNLEVLTQLNEFWLTRAYGLTKVTFPRRNNLVEVVFRKIPSLCEVDSWAYAKNLDRLWITECKKLGISAIADAGAVRELDLFNMGPVASLNFVTALGNLERLRLSGSTEISDGRLAFLLNLPKLKSVTFPPKEHYDLLPEDAQKLLENRSRSE